MALGGKNVIRTKIKVDGSKKAQTNVKGYTKELDALSNSAKGLAGGLAAFGPAGLAAAAGLAAVGAAAAVATKAVQGFIAIGQRGGEFAAIARGYERLADESLLRRLQELSGWHVSQRNIMVAFTRATETGVITQEQFAEALDLIVTRAQQTGESAEQMLVRMTPLLQGRGIEQITDLGVQSGVLADALRQAGLSAEGAEGQVERLALGLRLAREQIGETDNAATNLADSWEASNTQMNDYIDNMSQVVSESPALVGVFEEVRITMEGVGISAESMGAFIANSVRQIIVAVSSMVISLSDVLREYMQLVASAQEFMRGTLFGQAMMHLGISLRQGDTGAEFFRALSATAQRVRSIAAGEGVVRPDGTQQDRPDRPRPRPGTGGGAGASAAQIADEQFFNDLIFTRVELERQAEVDRVQNVIDLNDARERLAETFIDLDLQQAQMEEANHARRMERADELKQSVQNLFEKEREAEEEAAAAREESMTNTFDAVSSVASSTSKIFNSVSSVIGALSGDTEEAARRQGAFLVAFSSVMAVVEAAKAIADYADLDIVGGLAHTAAAAAFVAAAAQAGSELGGGTAKAPAPGGAFTPASPERVQPTGDGAGGVTIVENYSLGRSEADMGLVMRDAEWAMSSSGVTSNRGLAASFGA